MSTEAKVLWRSVRVLRENLPLLRAGDIPMRCCQHAVFRSTEVEGIRYCVCLCGHRWIVVLRPDGKDGGDLW